MGTVDDDLLPPPPPKRSLGGDDMLLPPPPKKKATTAAFPTGSNLLQNVGAGLLTPQAPTELSPVLPQARAEVAQRQQEDLQKEQAQKTALSERFKKIRSELPADAQKMWDKAIELTATRAEDKLREPTPEEIAHDKFMQTPVGKTLGVAKYLTSKASKGAVQVARGLAHYATTQDPTSEFEYLSTPEERQKSGEAVNRGFDKLNEVTDYGLTRNDLANIEDNRLVSGLGGLAEFAPAAATAAPTAGMTLFLQGAGQADEQLHEAEKNGAKIDPLVKEAYIGGVGIVNKFLMHDLATGVFNKLPVALRGDIAAKITADAIKEASGKELTGEAFKSLLENGAKKFADKIPKLGLEAMKGYNKAAKDLSALTGANFLLKKGVDATTDKPVFGETAGDLAQQINEIVTKDAPIFAGIGEVKNLSKLTKYSNYKNSVVESLMADTSPETVEKTKQALKDYAIKNEWSPEETEATVKHVDEIARVARSLPKNIKPEKLEDAVDLINGRDELKKELTDIQVGRDEALKEVSSPGEQLIIDKIDQANDKLRGLVTGKPVTYSKGVGEEEGLFFKAIDGKKEEITPERYELEAMEREARREEPKPVEEVAVEETVAEKPPVIIKNTEGRPYTLEEINEGIKGVEEGTIKQPPEAEMADIIAYRDYLAKNEQAPVREEAVADVQVEPTEPVAEAESSPAPVEVETVAEVTVDPVRQKAIDAITHGIVGIERPGESGPRFDLGIPVAEQKRGIRDIGKGNYETVAAKKMIDKIAEFEAKGEYPIIEGSGGSSVRSRAATAQEIQESLDSAKQYKATKLSEERAAEFNKYAETEHGLTEADFDNYEQYRNDPTGERASLKRDAENATGKVQRPANDKRASKPQDTGGKAAQRVNEPRAGDPIRAFATKLRDGKISKLGGFKAGTGFEMVWDASLEVVATAAEGGAKIADAIEAGLKHIKQTEWYKNLSEKDKFDTEYRKHLKSEYDVVEKALPAKNAENEAVAADLGLKVDKSATGKRTNEVIEREATEAIKEGYDTPELVDRILNDKHAASDVEVAILAKYRDAKETQINEQLKTIADDGATMSKKKFNELTQENDAALLEMQDVVDAIRKTGSATGSALRARQMEVKKENSLANFIIQKRQALGGEKLTAEQLAEVTKTVNELEATQKALTARLEKVEAENTKLKAERAVKKATTERAGRLKPTKESLEKERVQLREELSEKLKKMRSQGLNSAGKASAEFLQAVAPYVAKMTRNLAQEGVLEVQELIKRLKKELDLDDLDDRDMMDLVAGKYDEVKPTRSDLQAGIRSLREQAKIASEIADIEAGKKTTTTILKGPKARNEHLESLRKRLSELTKGEEPTVEEKSLSATKKRLQANIDKLSKRIADGDYAKEEAKKAVPLDAEALELRRKYDKIKREFDLQVARDHLAQRTKSQKFIDDALNITALPRALKSSFDFSAAGRQGLFLAPHFKEVGTAFKEMFGQAFSEKRYDDWISDLKHTELYDLMKESGLYIADKSDPKLMAREEQFTSTLAERIPGVKQSERAYTAYLNVLRTGVFESEARKLMERGYTPEADPKEFTSLARVINILSGRGEIPKSWGHSAPKVLSLGLFSPRFMMARIQTLALWADPTLSRNAKILAAKDVGSVLGSAAILLTMAAAAGYKVNTDETSTNFLKIQDEEEDGSTYYDILGGLPQYVRFLSQITEGKRTSAAGNVTDLTAERGPDNPFGATRLDVLGTFARGKLAPVPGMGLNLLQGKDVVGQPYGFSNIPLELLPLPFTDVQSAYKVGGIDNALRVLTPATFGIGVSSY